MRSFWLLVIEMFHDLKWWKKQKKEKTKERKNGGIGLNSNLDLGRQNVRMHDHIPDSSLYWETVRYGRHMVNWGYWTIFFLFALSNKWSNQPTFCIHIFCLLPPAACHSCTTHISKKMKTRMQFTIYNYVKCNWFSIWDSQLFIDDDYRFVVYDDVPQLFRFELA